MVPDSPSTTPAVLGDLVTRDRRSDDDALVATASGRTYDYRRFCTSAWKVGNFLSHLGVRRETTVAIAGHLAPEPVLTVYGAAMLGATVRFDPTPETDARAVVVPSDDVDRYEVPPGSTVVGYGSEPDDPTVAYFERDVWSENPTEPPGRVGPAATVLAVDGATYSHRVVLEAASETVERLGLTATDRVAVRAPLTHPGTVAAGLVAPVLAGGAVLLPDEGGSGTVAVASSSEDVPEHRTVDPETVLDTP